MADQATVKSVNGPGSTRSWAGDGVSSTGRNIGCERR